MILLFSFFGTICFSNEFDNAVDETLASQKSFSVWNTTFVDDFFNSCYFNYIKRETGCLSTLYESSYNLWLEMAIGEKTLVAIGMVAEILALICFVVLFFSIEW